MKVLKQLQIKFVYSMVLIEMFVFAGILLSLNFAITRRESNEARDFLVFLANNKGHSPRHMDLKPTKVTPEQIPFVKDIDAVSSASREHPEDFLRTVADFFRLERPQSANLRNYFSAIIREDGSINELIQDFPLSYTKNEIQFLVTEALATKKQCASVDGVMFYKMNLSETEQIVCFLNRNSELKTLGKFYIYSSLLYLLSIIISMFISVPISKYMIKPAEEAFNKQKQFIADAGHELKTPVAVISANIDVLENELKDNRWLGFIKAENQRMGELIKDLLYLARNDAGRNVLNFNEFDFSNAVENATLPFEVIAFESGKEMNFDIEKNIMCVGDEKTLKQVFVILVDNAIKNSDKGAKITVRAFSESQRIIYKVHNTGAGIPKEELEKIFLRFYRSDSSRARRTGGYGLGLAIARAIAQDHGGTLVANSELGKWAEFTLTLPKRKL